MTRSVSEWRSFQKRNENIEQAGKRVREKGHVKKVQFYSEGVRITGSYWIPKQPLSGNPAILLCHGWGGLRSHLDIRYASKFVEEGFHVLTFDYRGWGDSDGVLISTGGKLHDDAQTQAKAQDNTEQTPVKSMMEVRIIRQTVDMVWQLEDIDSAISFLSSEPGIGKIGIWGSSQGGGHVLEQGARDPNRVSCIVSQVPSVGKNGAGDISSLDSLINQARVKASRDGHIPVGAREFHLPAMDGAPILRRLQWYNPLLSCPTIQTPTLIIDAEKEELWDPNKNGKAAFDLIPSTSKEYYILKGADHYDAYDKSAKEARDVAVRFFKKHLVSTSRL